MIAKNLIIAAATLVAASSLTAATITWTAAQSVTADTDVSTLGTLVSSYNAGGSSTTINGVTFSGTAPAEFSSGWTGYPSYGTKAGLSTGYAAALNDGAYNASGTTTTIAGLVSGQTYQIQFWFVDLRPSNAATTLTLDSGASTPSVVLASQGQYTIGSFVANATTQAFRITSSDTLNEGATVNLYQLRNISAVPEPSTYGLLGAGALAGVALVRRRKRPAQA